MKERRQAKRVDFDQPIWLWKTRGRKKFRGEIKDISLGGLGVVVGTTRHFCFGEKVRFEILLHTKSGGIKIKGRGEVSWLGRGGRMGIALTKMKDDDFARLRRLMEWNLGSVEKPAADLLRRIKQFLRKIR